MGVQIPDGKAQFWGVVCPISFGAFAAAYAKAAELIEIPFGADSCGPKEPSMRRGSRSDEPICHRQAMRPFAKLR